MSYLPIDSSTADILKVVLEAAQELDDKLQALREAGNVHVVHLDWDIAFRYDGSQNEEWFAAGFWTGDWPEIIHGIERERQLKQREKKA